MKVVPAPISTAATMASSRCTALDGFEQAAPDFGRAGVDGRVVDDDDGDIAVAFDVDTGGHGGPSGEHDDAVGRAHALTLWQHEHRIRLRLDEPRPQCMICMKMRPQRVRISQ